MSLPRAAPSEAGLPCVSCSFRTRVAESGHHSLKLFLRTGLHLGENQTRRLLSDIASLRAYLEQNEDRPVSEVVAVNRWLAEVYDPVVAVILADLRGRLASAEIFHESSSIGGTYRSGPDGTSAPPPRVLTSSACSPKSRSRRAPPPALSKVPPFCGRTSRPRCRSAASTR